MLWYSLEARRQGPSNEYPQHEFSWRNKKNINLIPSHPTPFLSRDMVSQFKLSFSVVVVCVFFFVVVFFCFCFFFFCSKTCCWLSLEWPH